MKSTQGIDLKNVQQVYDGVEGDLWELIMGEQIHIGGLKSSMDLAERAGIGPGMSGIDLCACSGAGMRFLVKLRNVDKMLGVDATSAVIERGLCRCAEMGLSNRIEFILADVCSSALPDAGVDFIWGEDAWCYVVDKPRLISEAARLVKAGGCIAFTDWVEGPVHMTDTEAERLLTFMKFPNIQDIDGYSTLLQNAGCEVLVAENTDRFAKHVDLYLSMLDMQLSYDALKIINFDMDLLKAIAGEMLFMQSLAHEGKIIQGIFVARKN